MARARAASLLCVACLLAGSLERGFSTRGRAVRGRARALDMYVVDIPELKGAKIAAWLEFDLQ